MIIFGSPTQNSDWIIGDDGNDWIYGDGGNDLLQGGGGNDLLLGNDGDDTLVPGLGVDFVYGGFLNGDSGNDTVSYALYDGAVSVNLSMGYGYLTSLRDADKDTLNGIENVRGSAYADGIIGNAGANKLYGNDGTDSLDGGAGDDALYGGNGDDILRGGAGADLLDGGAGKDLISYLHSPTYVVAHLGYGYGLFGDAQGDVLAGIEDVQGSAGGDFLFGSSAANSLMGVEGNDTLRGLEGNDRLYGGEGDDTLYGDAGVDWLRGGEGKDKMSGGANGDLFVFGNGEVALAMANADVITDFSQAQGDKIVLSSMDANVNLANHQGFVFIGDDGFSGTAGELRIGYNNGNTIVSGDTDGDDDANFVIVLTGHHELVAGDFIL